MNEINEMKLFLLDCFKDENVSYQDDDVVLNYELEKRFLANDKLEKIEIIVLDDDYVDFLKKDNKKDNPVNRLEYYVLNPDRDYDEIFKKSSFSAMFDGAIIPIAMCSKTAIEGEKTFDFTKKQKREIEKLLQKELIPEIDKKIIISDCILDLKQDYSEKERELANEIIDNQPDLVKSFKTFRFTKKSVLDFGYIYVACLFEVPRIITRNQLNDLNNDEINIVNYKYDPEKLEEIINTFNNFDITVITSCAIYEEEIAEVISAFYSMLKTQREKSLSSLKKFEEASKFHKKKKK